MVPPVDEEPVVAVPVPELDEWEPVDPLPEVAVDRLDVEAAEPRVDVLDRRAPVLPALEDFAVLPAEPRELAPVDDDAVWPVVTLLAPAELEAVPDVDVADDDVALDVAEADAPPDEDCELVLEELAT